MAAGSESPPPLGAADLSLVDQALNKLDQLHRLSVDPQLGLRNSPPYLPELVSETAVLLEQVWEPYRALRWQAAPGPGLMEPRS
ncbi:hypothetical protein D4764_0266260 [Takifugu flavidus]|uniref:Cbl-PTB domain-containing protein n=1 Tax=Takifugu flavidus TaxID=433684 RepID=A0A5C6MHP6_9TELE|nr:hypothetical protein D4764_0266260 [Takifugu flavidus]